MAEDQVLHPDSSYDGISPRDMLCIMCEKNVFDIGKGISIENFVLENMPPKLQICKTCAENLAIGLMTGSLGSLKSLGKIFSAITGRKKT